VDGVRLGADQKTSSTATLCARGNGIERHEGLVAPGRDICERIEKELVDAYRECIDVEPGTGASADVDIGAEPRLGLVHHRAIPHRDVVSRTDEGGRR
jgi:hypothetical protein